jgi:class 3 adenylate cyclase
VSTQATKEISDWLETLGLGQYAHSFAENGIDVSVLPHLTDQDLKDLGVLLGHRRKMLAAIAEPVCALQAPPQPALTEPKPQDTAERRQVTVMFSDLVGSTALAARMDPEDLREVISAYQKCVAETVGRFGGFVAKYLGDGVLVYFGYPQAHEDDAERAVRAGLELVTAVDALKTRASLQTRVGIATGLVVVGDLIGTGSAQEQAIVGETPNLAARLQGIAEPNTVVIAESTRKLLGNLFDLQDLSAQNLKGIGSPVRAWAVLRPASIESRFEALHASGLTELVGREEEIELLLRRWSKAKTGEGQVVLLSGEPGIGKSRLTTGVSILADEADGKRQDILIEAVPGLRLMAVLVDINYTKNAAKLAALQEAARAHSVEFSIHRIAKGVEIAAAIDNAQASGATALNIVASPLFYAHRHLIMERTAAAHLPTIYEFPEPAEEGGFAGYGPRLSQLSLEVLLPQVVKVLRGTKVADIPVEQATKLELVINLKTAKAMGVTFQRHYWRERTR